MRAIHRVAPRVAPAKILEVGGGRSGLASLLYPEAHVTNIDIDPALAGAPCNQQPQVTFVAGDATALPFEDETFDMVTMFDLLEHVPDDQAAVRQGLRVLRPGGALMISTPHTRWRYPHFRPLRHFAPTEQDLFAEWGHVRRGYTLGDLETLIGFPPQAWASFINPVTAFAHDIAFSHLPQKRLLLTLLAPITWAGYVLHRHHGRGTETASTWLKSNA